MGLSNLPGYVDATTPIQRASFTLDNWGPGITSIALNKKVVVYLLRMMGQVEENARVVDVAGANIAKTSSGGKQFRERHRFRLNTSTGTVGVKANIPAIEQDNVTYSYIDVKCIGGQILIYDIEAAMNASPEGMINLMKAEKDDIIQAITDVLSTSGVWASGTGDDLDGIPTFCNTTALQSYGGIDPNDLPTPANWDNIISEDVAIGAFATNEEGMFAMDDVYSRIVEGCGYPPDLWACRAFVWNRYKRTMTGTINYNLPLAQAATTVTAKHLADLGIQALYYAGAPVVIDGDTPMNGAGNYTMYALNTKKIKFKALSKANFKFEAFQRGVEKQAMSSMFHWFCNTHCLDRRAFGVLPVITG